MKIYHDLQQGSPEWLDVRRRNFTASKLGQWALEPITFRLSVDEIKAKLDELGVSRKGVTKKDDLIDLLPFPAMYRELCDGARTAILAKIKQGIFAQLNTLDDDDPQLINAKTGDRTPLYQWLAREREIQEKDAKSFDYNIPVKYGKLLEPYAREFYERKTGLEVIECGFIESDFGGFGCSPDGLVSIPGDEYGPSKLTHGVEIKCPTPETHAAWLLAGELPEEHKLQVHACMAVCGPEIQRWDFLSYCPGDAPLLITVHRCDFTDRLEAGLKTLVAEKAKIKAKLSAMWQSEYGKGEA